MVALLLALAVTAPQQDPEKLRQFALMAFSGATVTDLRFDLGYHVDRFALTFGVRPLISSDGDDLTGPTLGLAVFF